MKFLAFQKLGENRGSPRIWIESKRLDAIGFSPGIGIQIESRPNGLLLRPALLAENHVSSRLTCKQIRPIIDIANRDLLSTLKDFAEVKIAASFHQINLAPSTRAFYIRRRLETSPPFKVLEMFAGGGTLSAAIAALNDFKLIAAIEMEPKYADIWQQAHPSAILYQTDIRLLHPTDLPAHDILVAAIPCTSHSSLGRAKKGLAGKPELGDSGDLYLSICELVANRLPLACVFENVPGFGNSLAGQSLCHHLGKLGYYVEQSIIDPHGEWDEPQDRRRWVAIATLKPGFKIFSPLTPFERTAGEFLDAPSEQDDGDVRRIRGSINSLRLHNKRHAALGHGFGFTTINQESRKVPTIVRSYHKINTGPFVETKHGLRLLRKSEVERLMGCEINCSHYATAVEILGQGVQTRIFQQILGQLSQFLKGS